MELELKYFTWIHVYQINNDYDGSLLATEIMNSGDLIYTSQKHWAH